MWARFSSTGTCDVSKDLFAIATIIGASSLVHDLSSQVGIGSRLQDLSDEDSMMPMISSFVVGANESSVTCTSHSNDVTRPGVSSGHRES